MVCGCTKKNRTKSVKVQRRAKKIGKKSLTDLPNTYEDPLLLYCRELLLSPPHHHFNPFPPHIIIQRFPNQTNPQSHFSTGSTHLSPLHLGPTLAESQIADMTPYTSQTPTDYCRFRRQSGDGMVENQKPACYFVALVWNDVHLRRFHVDLLRDLPI